MKDVKLLATVLFLVGAWQLDVLVSPLVFALRDQQFYFWIGSLSFWDAYSLFFWVLGIAFFMGLWFRDIISVIGDLATGQKIEIPTIHWDFGNPSQTKTYMIAILLMIEAIMIPLSLKLSSGEMPTLVEFGYWISLGILQLVTYFLAFLRGDENGKEKSEANDATIE